MTAKKQPWHPQPYEQKDIRALQALAVYAQAAVMPDDNIPPPSPHDVKRALDWIVHTASGTYEPTFTHSDPNTSAYLEGRRSVGLAIVKLLAIKPEVIKNER